MGTSKWEERIEKKGGCCVPLSLSKLPVGVPRFLSNIVAISPHKMGKKSIY